jgi:very-short-patch-repair endonuclease
MATKRPDRPTFEIDATLRRIAQPQLGLVTVSAATRAGIDDSALARRRHSGALVPVFAEVMRLGGVEPSSVQTILAASLAVRSSTVGGISAAVVHQMPVRPIDCVGQPVVVVEAHRSARTKGITVVRTAHLIPSQRWFTTGVATPTATWLQLVRFVDLATVERCLDHSIAHRLTSVRALSDLIGRFPARAVPGRKTMLDLFTERSEGIGHRSRLEQTVAGWLSEAGLRGWRRNYRAPVGGGRSVEVDFAWIGAKVALEVSPFFTHGSRSTQERDAERRMLLVVAGWQILEATDVDLESERAFATVATALVALLGDAIGRSRALSLAERAVAHTTPLRTASEKSLCVG